MLFGKEDCSESLRSRKHALVFMEIGNRSFYRKSRRWIASVLEKVTLKQQRQFYFLAALIGLITGISAVAFHRSIDWAEDNFIHTVNDLSGVWVYVFLIVTPTLGGLIVGFLIRYWAPEAAGSGIPQTKAAYFIKFGRIRFRTAVSKFILGTISIGSGASLGREGPTVQISAALASWVGRWLGLPPKLVMRLIPLGAAGGIAAAFNTPLAAIMFAIEEIMGDFKHRALAGIVLVAVIAAVIERSLLGSSSVFSVPEHPEFLPAQLVWSLLIGLLAGVFSHLFVEILLRLRQRAKARRGRFAWTMPAIGGFLTGIIGCVVFIWTQRLGVFGIGYHDMSEVLFGRIGLSVMLILFVGKFLATIVSYSSGGSGGIFAPTLFIGAMLGGAVGGIAELVGQADSSMVGTLALIGMGAMFAGIIRAPVTSILIIFELTGDYSLILPIMLANLTAYALANKWRRIPIYEALLLQDGINLRKFPMLRPSFNWQNLPINTIMTNEVISLRANALLPEALKEISHAPYKLFPVLDAQDKYLGMVHHNGIVNVAASHPERSVRDLLIKSGIAECYTDLSISDAARLFVQSDHMTLPVLSRLEKGRLLGVVTLHDITRQQFLQESQGE